MRKYIIAALALLGLGGNVMAQRDITSTYITNATLSAGMNTGWTVTYTGSGNYSHFNTVEQGNNTIGYATEAYAGWGELAYTAYSMTQTITLPIGNYRLVNYSFFRQGQNYNTDSSKSLAYLKAGAQQVAIKTLGSIDAAGYANSQAEGANCFDSKMYRNVVEFTSDGSPIEIGVYGTFDAAYSWCIVGMFELFDLDDVASVSSPTDITYAITNPGFEYRNLSGWTNNITVGNNTYGNNNNFSSKAGIGFYESWQASGSGGLGNAGTFTQTLEDMPAGLYELSVYAQNIEQYNSSAGGTGMFVTANSNQTEIGSNGRYTVRTTLAYDGDLTIGIKLQGCTGNWIAVDRFGLQFYGDPLQAYKDLLDAKVTEAQALVDGGTLRTGAAGQLQTVIDNNDNDDDAFTTESEFNTAVSNIEAAMTLANSIAARYAVFDAEKTKWEALKAGVPSCASLTTFESAVSTANTAVTNATSVATVNTQIAALRPAAMTFISTTDDHTFDLTFMASQTYSDWKKKDGSAAGIVADQYLTGRPGSIPSFAESYESTCATTGTVLYQTIEDLPAGYYEVGMYAQAMYTTGRGFDSDATEGDADRTYAFAGDLDAPASILRVGMPISFQSSVAFEDITTLAVNVHLTGDDLSNNLTYGVQKDENGSNWHFAQIMTITYATQPDLTALEAQRDEKVAIAEGFLATHLFYLNNDQSDALQDAIDEAKAADDFGELSTVIVSLPTAVDAARILANGQKIGRESLLNALQRFEDNYNHYIINDVSYGDGTDYRRLTMSAGAWTSLLTLVNTANTALDDRDSNAAYATLATNFNNQMDATDTSIRLFKSYKAMVAGCQALSIAAGTTYATDANMDTDATENTAIAALNTAFVSYQEDADGTIDMAGFLGSNLDFNSAETGEWMTTTGGGIKNIDGWEEVYSNIVEWQTMANQKAGYTNQLYIRSNWNGASRPSMSVLKECMLPAGEYTLSFDFKINEALSWTARTDNLCYYKLDNTSYATGANTTEWATQTYSFVLEEPTKFDLSFGFVHKTANNSPVEFMVDNVALTMEGGNPFQNAYDAAEAVAATGNAAQAAIDQWSDYDGDAATLKALGADAPATYWKAVDILRNAKTIVDNSGDATSLIANYDLSNTTLSDGKAPNGWGTGIWTADDTHGHDIWVNTQNGEQVYNVWYRDGITDIEINHTISNLPSGTYRFTADLGSAFDGDAANMVAFSFEPAQPVSASQQINVINEDPTRLFGTFSTASVVTNTSNSLTIGIRSRGHYFQMKGLQLEYISDATTAAQEVAAGRLRQDYFWAHRGDAEYDVTATATYDDARGVRLYPTNPNQIITATSGQISNDHNVVVGGVCANLVITDGTALAITSTTGPFRATSASYSRPMPTNRWGTLILPFPVQARDGLAFYTLREVDEGEGTMTFNREGKKFDANTPLVYRITDGATTLEITASDVDVALTTAEQNDETSIADWEAEGTYARTTKDKGEGYYYISNDKFWLAETKDVNINPFRAWFHYTGSSPVKAFSIAFNEDWTDGVEELTMDNGEWTMDGKVYDLQGRRVSTLSTLKKGIYIVNGRKVYVK